MGNEEFEKWMNTSHRNMKDAFDSAFAAGQAAEREECAKIATLTMCDDPNGELDVEWDNACCQIAKAIRARATDAGK